jgi:hypothetical protein
MERLAVPWLFLGPAGSGKTQHMRTWIGDAHGSTIESPLEMRTLTVGDGYEARVYTSPHHFEIDIPNLSMQDKQIIGELLTTFFSSTDVFNSLRASSRKLVVLRRAHSLSLPAAVRVRAILQQYVFPPDATGMLWITAREMTGPLLLLSDGFCTHRVPRLSFTEWCAKSPDQTVFHNQVAYEACEGRTDRVKALHALFPTGTTTFPRRIQDYYDELIRLIIHNARSGATPTLNVVNWLRASIYQMLSFCQTGPDIVDCCAAAVQRQVELLEPHVFWKAMESFTKAEPHTSYRTPLSLEMVLLNLFECIREHSSVVPLPSVATATTVPVSTTIKRVVRRRTPKKLSPETVA